MKNLRSKFRITLMAVIVVGFYNFKPGYEKELADKSPEMVVDLVSMGAIKHRDLKNQATAREIMRDLQVNELNIMADSTNLMAIPALPSNTHVPDLSQKITFSIISSILVFFFLFLAIFSTRLLREDEHKNKDSLKTISLLRFSVLVLFYQSLISIPVSYFLHGMIARSSVSLFLICAMAATVLIFHVFLKKAECPPRFKSNLVSLTFIDKIFPVITIIIGLFLCIPAWTNQHYSELNIEIITIYMILSMLHVGRKALTSTLIQSSLVKQVFNA